VTRPRLSGLYRGLVVVSSNPRRVCADQQLP
jgi:hypothetical protein